jgi:hypothetical protein
VTHCFTFAPWPSISLRLLRVRVTAYQAEIRGKHSSNGGGDPQESRDNPGPQLSNQGVQQLPCMSEALGSVPSTAKN